MASAGNVSPEEPFDWETLLAYIEDRQVIPVVGKELLVLPIDGEEIPLERYLATRIAEAFEIPRETLSEGFDLTEVALSIDSRGARRKLYPRIVTAMKELTSREPLPIPAALLQLASITDFQLFVSTTFDPFLKAALDHCRFEGADRTAHLVYSAKKEVQDLSVGLDELTEPLVYQILGKLSSVVGDYAATDEDAMEFLYNLQSDRRPPRLFDELKERHLLFLGCGFPDWLALFFIRTIANHPLRGGGDTAEVIADLANRDNERFKRLMRDCEAYTFFPSGDPLEFVHTLAEQWQKRNPAVASEPTSARTGGATPDAPSMEHGAVFVSYASEDLTAAENLKTALEQSGLEVWFDKDDLHEGAWKRSLRKNVAQCSLFMPLLSRHSAGRHEGVYREEWSWALERSVGITDDAPFIQPIVVDDLPDRSPGIPDRFWDLQVSRFDAARPTPDFVERAKQAVRSFRLGSR